MVHSLTIRHELTDEYVEVRISSEGYKPVIRKVDPYLNEILDLEPEEKAQD